MQMNTKSTITVRRANERGTADHGWLHARFTFSFGNYFDPDHMGFRSLRVMNNDTIEPGGGFPAHPHSDMEIFTYVIEGELAHKDSMGNGSVIKAGDLQYMSAGSGVTHSEFNPSKENLTHLYQIWLQPSAPGGEPRYAEKPLGTTAVMKGLKLLFSSDGRDNSTAIRQTADIYFADVAMGETLAVPQADSNPHVWLQVIEGEVSVYGESLTTGDGIAVEHSPGEAPITISTDSKLLLFRLA
ncbi:MAG: redox-sensitive bicupin YhaK (pirin superfamily) [Verrucomicrobiales bacterium]|jgi:redox-sensitive bicupin YhaK (pirin superfamily)